MKCHKKFRSSQIAWEADVLPLNYARESRQPIAIVAEFSMAGDALPRLDSTERRHTELPGTESPAKVPQVRPCLHFIGFRDDRYWSAVRIWGRPHFIHRGWDLRARRDIDPSDTVVFAEGDADQPPRVRSYDDLREGHPSGATSWGGLVGRV